MSTPASEGQAPATTRRRIATGSPLETAAGYARAVVQGDWCFVSGTTGYDYARMTMPDGVAAQAEQALATIARVLAEAGFAFADIVRATYILADAADWPALVPVLGRTFGTAPPAATAIVAGLVAPEMRVEIEVTALRQTP